MRHSCRGAITNDIDGRMADTEGSGNAAIGNQPEHSLTQHNTAVAAFGSHSQNIKSTRLPHRHPVRQETDHDSGGAILNMQPLNIRTVVYADHDTNPAGIDSAIVQRALTNAEADRSHRIKAG